MALEGDAKLKKNWLAVWKITWGIWQSFYQSTWKFRLKFGTFMRYFYPKQKMYELKIHRGVMCYDNEEQGKISKRID